jgi:hypothetical protein
MPVFDPFTKFHRKISRRNIYRSNIGILQCNRFFQKINGITESATPFAIILNSQKSPIFQSIYSRISTSCLKIFSSSSFFINLSIIRYDLYWFAVQMHQIIRDNHHHDHSEHRRISGKSLSIIILYSDVSIILLVSSYFTGRASKLSSH